MTTQPKTPKPKSKLSKPQVDGLRSVYKGRARRDQVLNKTLLALSRKNLIVIEGALGGAFTARLTEDGFKELKKVGIYRAKKSTEQGRAALAQNAAAKEAQS